MTIQEIKKRKKELENMIFTEIEKFEKESSCQIIDIIQTTTKLQSGERLRTHLKLKMEVWDND